MCSTYVIDGNSFSFTYSTNIPKKTVEFYKIFLEVAPEIIQEFI